MKVRFLKEGVGEGIAFKSSRLDSMIVHKVQGFNFIDASEGGRRSTFFRYRSSVFVLSFKRSFPSRICMRRTLEDAHKLRT
jgi:hypothetical protein